MANEDIAVTITGIVVDQEIELTLVEICRACAAETDFIAALVDEGALEPSGGEPGAWRFTGTELQRAILAVRLQRDLGLNPAGVALGLQLLEEIRTLRARLAAHGDQAVPQPPLPGSKRL